MEDDVIKIVIADDHKIFRDGLKLLFKRQNHLKVVGEARDGIELLQIVKEEKPCVVILDIKMPQMDGIEATRDILRFKPDIAIIAMSMSEEESIVMEMIEAGAKGYLLKDATKEDILSAIECVRRDKPFYSNAIISLMVKYSQRKIKPVKVPVIHFTEKELQIITLICKEMTSKEIGEKLFNSYKTIEYHKSKIMEKMQVRSTIGIVLFAVKNNLITV